ncbi:hypothetical protein, partial [Falsirhodobacter sp. 1013]|uniref:hypothetical protein n=1 Tax=Falsirhodobacter sp. 1013 TaxID=3417566 RepID=UPI003EBA9F88
LQDLDRRAGHIHPEPDPEDAGIEHLGHQLDARLSQALQQGICFISFRKLIYVRSILIQTHSNHLGKQNSR